MLTSSAPKIQPFSPQTIRMNDVTLCENGDQDSDVDEVELSVESTNSNTSHPKELSLPGRIIMNKNGTINYEEDRKKVRELIRKETTDCFGTPIITHLSIQYNQVEVDGEKQLVRDYEYETEAPGKKVLFRACCYGLSCVSVIAGVVVGLIYATGSKPAIVRDLGGR